MKCIAERIAKTLDYPNKNPLFYLKAMPQPPFLMAPILECDVEEAILSLKNSCIVHHRLNTKINESVINSLTHPL